MAARRERLTVRLEPGLRAELRAHCDRTGGVANRVVVLALRDYLARRDVRGRPRDLDERREAA